MKAYSISIKNKLLHPNIKIQTLLFFISIAFFLNYTNYLFFIPFPIMLYLFFINIKTIKIDFDFICIVFLSFFNAGYSILFLVNIGLPASLMYLFVLSFIIYTITGCLVIEKFISSIKEKTFFKLFLLTSFLVSVFWYLVLIFQRGTNIGYGGLTIYGSAINIFGVPIWGANVFWVCSTPYIYLVPFYIKRFHVTKKLGFSLFIVALAMSIIISSKFMMLYVIISFLIIYPLYFLLLFIPIILFSTLGYDTHIFLYSYDRILTLPSNGRFQIWNIFIKHNNEIGLISSNLINILHNIPINIDKSRNTSFHCFTMNMAACVGYLGAFLSFVYIAVFLHIARKAKLFCLGCLYIIALSTCVAGEDPHLIAVMIIFFYGIIKCYKEGKPIENE